MRRHLTKNKGKKISVWQFLIYSKKVYREEKKNILLVFWRASFLHVFKYLLWTDCSWGWQCLTNKSHICISKIFSLIYNFNFTTLYVTRFKLGDFNSIFLSGTLVNFDFGTIVTHLQHQAAALLKLKWFSWEITFQLHLYMITTGGADKGREYFSESSNHKCTHAHTWSSKPDGVKKDALASWQILEITSLSGTVTLPSYYIPV